MNARIHCCDCGTDLTDPGTPLATLEPALVADLAQIHDLAEHGGLRDATTYDAVVTAVVMMQAQHEGTP